MADPNNGHGPVSAAPTAGNAAALPGPAHGEAALAYPTRDLEASKLARTLRVLLRKPQPRVRRFVAGPAPVDPTPPPTQPKAPAPRRSTPPESSFGHKTGHRPAADIPTYDPTGDEPETKNIDVRTNRDMTFWLDDRLKKRKDVEEMGLSEDWLRSKVRTELEEEVWQERYAKPAAKKKAEAEGNAPPRGRRRERRRSLELRPPVEDDTAELNLDRPEIQASLGLGGTKKSRRHAMAEHLFRKPGFTKADGLRLLRGFIRKNRWRLHHLFLKSCGSDDYLISVEEICTLIEPVGGLVPLDKDLQQSVAYEEAQKANGTLKPLSTTQLRALVGLYGVDRHGLLDYRKVLDDYLAEEILEHRLRLDRVKRRQQANNQPTNHLEQNLSVHEEIGRSIGKYRNTYAWLLEDHTRKANTRSRFSIAARPRPKSPPQDFTPREVGWRGICRVPGSHCNKCPGFNKGEGNPHLVKWYAEQEAAKHGRRAKAPLRHQHPERTASQQTPEPEVEQETDVPLHGAELNTSLTLPDAFSKDEFADLRMRQWTDFKDIQAALASIGKDVPERRLLHALVSPKEHAT